MTLWDSTRCLLGADTLGHSGVCTIRHKRTGHAPEPDLDSDFMISLNVPGTLAYRPLVLRVVESSCKLVRLRSAAGAGVARGDFDDEVVSAFSEAFNNIVIHGYARHAGEVQIEIEPDDLGITIRMRDTGKSFEPDQVAAPQLEELPESGMGLFIIHSFMDEVSYRAGQPPHGENLLFMRKSLRRQGAAARAASRENSR